MHTNTKKPMKKPANRLEEDHLTESLSACMYAAAKLPRPRAIQTQRSRGRCLGKWPSNQQTTTSRLIPYTPCRCVDTKQQQRTFDGLEQASELSADVLPPLVHHEGSKHEGGCAHQLGQEVEHLGLVAGK